MQRLPQAACITSHTMSQFDDDQAILLPLLCATRNRPGTYVELGAFDGLLNANTAMFEACFNYRGLLIEANPTNFLALKAHGSKRPRSTLVHSAVCDDDSGDGIVNVTQQGGPPDASPVWCTANRPHGRARPPSGGGERWAPSQSDRGQGGAAPAEAARSLTAPVRQSVLIARP